ncbi:MAG: hypothetical protein MI785_07360 [Kiloniellales bacterium]|nr:hypothetical protein [Kiloniellales bacterium]
MNKRIEAELALLRRHYREVDYQAAKAMHWFQIHMLKTPEGWLPAEIPAVFAVTEGHPGVQPYGFFVPANLNKGGTPPNQHDAPHPPPFEGQWRFLSWSPEGWQPTADIATGSNLWGWVRTFMYRLREGI